MEADFKGNTINESPRCSRSGGFFLTEIKQRSLHGVQAECGEFGMPFLPRYGTLSVVCPEDRG